MAVDRDRLQKRMEELNLTAGKIAKRAGFSRSAIYQVLNERTMNPTSGTMEKVAEILDCDIAYLMGTQNVPRLANRPATSSRPVGGNQVPVVGTVQAGMWREVDELFEPSEFVTIDIDPNFPDARKFVLEVMGDSMNLGGIVEGDRIVCWDIHDYPFPMREGDDVVVLRSRDGGHFQEMTVKRLYFHPDGMKELRPISSNTSHKSYRIMPDDDADNGEEIRIIGMVEDIIRKHRRRIDQ